MHLTALYLSHFRIAKQYESNINAFATTKLRNIDGDLQTALLERAAVSLNEFKFHYAAGISFVTNDTIVAWHNGEMLHAAPLALNLVHTAIINSYASNEYSISVTNEPLPIKPEEELDDRILLHRAESTAQFLFPFVLYIIMAILSAKYTSFYIEVIQAFP